MTAPLVALMRVRSRAWLRHFLRSLKSPRRLVVAVMVLVAIGVFVTGASLSRGGGMAISYEALALLGAMTFVMSIVAGFMNRGPAFQLADVDFLFPAPFSRRELLVWRLVQLYPLTLLSTLVLFATMGIRMERPGRFIVGFILLSATALHLQLFISVALTRLETKVAERVRGVARRVGAVIALGALVVLMLVVARSGGWASLIKSALDSAVVKVLLFPVSACVDFVFGETWREAGFALLRLLLGVGASLALLLVPEIDFLEESAVTSARFGALASRRRRGELAADTEGIRARSRSGTRLRLLFRGSGAIVWKNLLLLARSLRVVVPSLAIGIAATVPMVLSMQRGESTSHPVSFTPLLVLVLFTSNSFGFDLRREGERLDLLRGLPLASSTIVFAELFVPFALSVVLQELLLVGFATFSWYTGKIAPDLLAWFALVVPFSTFLLVALDNLGFFLFPPRAAQGGRATFGTSGGAQIFRTFAWLLAHVPAAGTFIGLYLATRSIFWSFATAALIQLGMCLVAFLLLVRAYEKREFVPAD